MKFSHLAIELFEFVGYLPYLTPEQRKVMSRGFNLEPIVDLLKASLPASLAKTNKNNDDDDDSEVLSNESNGNKVLPNHARQLPGEHKNDTESLDLIIDVGALCHPKLLQEEDAVASGDCVDVVHACQAQDFQDFDDNGPHDFDFEQDPQESCYHYGTCATATTTAHGGYQHSTGWKVGTFYYNEEDDEAPTFYEDSQARLLSLNKVECTPQNTREIDPTMDYLQIGDLMKPCLPADDCDFPISCWDVSRVKSMYRWFYEIKVGDSINLRNWNTENVERMNYIFYAGRVPSGIWAWNVKNVKRSYTMFGFAEDMKNVNLQRWNLESLEDESYFMFQSTDWFHMYDPNELQKALTDDEIVRVCPHLKLLHKTNPGLLSGFRLEGNVIDCYCPKTTQSKVPIDSNEELKNWIDAEFQKEEKDQHFGCVEIGPNVDSFQDLFRDKEFIPNGIWGWDVSQVKSMNYTFRGAKIEQPLGIENWDLSQVTYAKGMFFQSQFRNDYLDTVDISTMSETAHMEGLFDDVIYDLLMDQLTPLRLRNLKPYLKYVVSRRAPVECTKENIRVIDPSMSDHGGSSEFKKLLESCLPWDVCSHPISCWDVSKVKSMYNWFAGSEFVSLDLKNWDTSNVESFASMFKRSSGDILGVHEWDVSKVKDMSLMFQSANVPLGISNWDTAAVDRLDLMFQDARNLENVDLESWDLNAVLPDSFAFQDVFKGTPYHRSKLAELKDDQILRVCPYLHLLRRNGEGDFSTFVPNGANEFSCFCPKGPWIQTTNEDFKDKLSAERTKAPSDRRFGCIEIGEDVDDMVGIFNTFDYIPNAIWTWDVSRVTTLEEAFSYVGDDTDSGKIEQPLRLERWNLESLTEAQSMFRGTNFGDHLHTLDMSSVPETANMTYMFLDSSARPDSDFESDGSVDGWTDTQIKALLPYVKFVRKKRMERECPA